MYIKLAIRTIDKSNHIVYVTVDFGRYLQEGVLNAYREIIDDLTTATACPLATLRYNKHSYGVYIPDDSTRYMTNEPLMKSGELLYKRKYNKEDPESDKIKIIKILSDLVDPRGVNNYSYIINRKRKFFINDEEILYDFDRAGIFCYIRDTFIWKYVWKYRNVYSYTLKELINMAPDADTKKAFAKIAKDMQDYHTDETSRNQKITKTFRLLYNCII